MKQNFLLLILLSSIITGIYFFIEQPDQKSQRQDRAVENIFSYNKESKISSLKTTNFELRKSENSFKVFPGDFIPNKKKLKTVLDFIQNIRARKILSDNLDETKFFSTLKNNFSFTFSDNQTVKYTIGNSLAFSDEFYLMITSKGNKKVVIAYNSTPSTIYSANSDLQYKKLLYFLKLSPKYFQ